MPPTGSRNYAGIDPSIRHTGLVIIGKDSLNILNIQPKKLQGTERLVYIRDSVRRQLVDCHQACIEGPSLYSVNRADDLGQVRGILLVVLADLKIPTEIVPPKKLKKFATGRGDASKEQMIKTAAKYSTVSITNDNEADAFWLATLARNLHENSPIKLKRYQLEVIHGIRNAVDSKGRVSNFRQLNI